MTIQHNRHTPYASSAKTGKHATFAILVLLFSLFLVGNALSESQKPQPGIYHILVLHSYHPGFPCTDTITEGIQSVFRSHLPDTHIDIEYIDSKRHQDPIFLSKIVESMLHYKLKSRTYDIVIVSGNEALSFALGHRSTILKGIPVIYCAANANLDKATSMSGVYGIRSMPDMAGVLRQIKKFHPNNRNVVVIGDTTDSYDKQNYIRFTEVAKTFAGEMNFDYWNNLSSETVKQRLTDLPTDSVLVINGYLNDNAGNLLSFNEQNALFRNISRIPMYSFWDVYLGEGIMGGPLTSPREQGKAAARMALSILKGDKVPQVPTSLNSTLMFDYNQLQRFGISQSSIPGGSRIINLPPNNFQISKGQFWIAISLLVSSITISLVLIRNIMNRRIAEAMLRESERNFRDLSQQFGIILDGISDGLSLISPDMKVVWSNKSTETFFNGTLGTTPGDNCCKLLYNRSSVCEECPAIKSFATGERVESIITTPDNRTLEVKAFPVVDKAGTVTHVIMLASDITEKNQLLEDSIRTGKLASIGELAAGVAHEINNPNAVIMLNSEILKKVSNSLTPILSRHFEVNGDFMLGGLRYDEIEQDLPLLFSEIIDSAARIKRIVDDLRNFAREDEPDTEEIININDAIRTSARLVGNAIKNATDRFELELCDEMPAIRGNLQRIEQVMVNLILNACQALPSKDRGIRISTAYDPDAGECIVTVADEGTGIPSEILPKVADPFFTTKRSQGGTGLGLSISMRIVRDFKGDLEFNSRDGEGTTVTLTIPVLKEAIAA